MGYRIEYFRCFLVIFIFSLGSFSGIAQDVYYEQFTDADGLPSMTTYQMIQDENGVLWMGTENGLVSYDGEKFERYSHPDLLDTDILELHKSVDGGLLFFNLSNQLGKMVNGKIEILFAGSGIKYFFAGTTTQDFVLEKVSNNKSSGYLSGYTVYTLEDEKLKHYAGLRFLLSESQWSLNSPKNRLHVFVEDDSLYLFTDYSRLNEKSSNDSRFNGYHFNDKEYVSNNSFFKAKVEEKDIVLLPTLQTYFVSRNFIENYNPADIQRIVISGDKYYVILHNRLELFDTTTSKSKILLDDLVVNTVLEDREGNIWVSTRDQGLIKIPNITLEVIPFRDKKQIISGVYASDKNVLIIWGDKLQLLNDNKNSALEIDLASNKNCAVTVYNNSFVIGTEDKYLWIDPDNNITFEPITYLPKSIGFSKSKLYAGRVSSLFIYNDDHQINGLFRYELDTTLNISRVYTLKYSAIQNIMLAGSVKGLFKIDEFNNGSEYIEELSTQNISDILETKDSTLWIATRVNGIYKIKDQKIIHHFNVSNGLLSNYINDLDSHGKYVYAASTNGIVQIDINTTATVIRNSCNGLPSNNITKLCIFKDSIWMAIQKDIVVVDSNFFNKENIPPTLSLKGFYSNNELVAYHGEMKFKYDENKIDIFLDNVSLSSGSNRSINYRIPNLDTTWTTSKEPVIRLPALKPGKYNVEAIGINGVGTQSETLNLAFQVLPPWWNTIWARIIGALILVLFVNFIILYRGKRIRKEEALKRDYISQINKIKEQALQLQMNPHFIFNSLNAIQGFIGTDEEEIAMNYLARFARLIRLIFEHSKGNTISLEEELEFIKLYLNLEKLRFKDKVNVEITVDSEVQNTKDIIKVPPLLIQPIVENSFKHGLFHKKEKGNLSIDYSMKNNLLQVTVKDDGIGREKAKKISQSNSEKHASSGIKTTMERIDLLNFGKDKKLNTIKIEDLYDKYGNAAGTKTILSLTI